MDYQATGESNMALMPKKEVTTPGSPIPDTSAPHTILGPEANFEGKLTFQGQVRIDGRFSGEIITDDVVVIGKDAEVKATVLVGALKLHGVLRGNVTAKHSIELHPPARLYGDIETPQLVIHSGVIFEGNCRMENLSQPRPRVLTESEVEAKTRDQKKPETKDEEKKP